MSCKKCKDGYVIDKETGFKVACTCKINERLGAEIRLENQAKGIGRKESKKMIVQDEEAIGLIPKNREIEKRLIKENRIDDNFDIAVTEAYKDIEEKVTNRKLLLFEDYAAVLARIYSKISKNESLERSYIIGSPKGYGKTTFANTCIKMMHRSGKNVVPYISCLELGELHEITWNGISNFKLLKDSMKEFELSMKKNDMELQYCSEDELENSPRINREKIEGTNRTRTILEKIIAGKIDPYFVWQDYLDADLVFVNLMSLPPYTKMEIPVLEALLNIRGSKRLSTVVFMNTGLGWYQNERKFGLRFVDEYVLDKAMESYYKGTSKLHHVSCYFDKKRLS